MDVVLVLLIIFMVTAPVLQSGIDVAVPKTRTVKQITEERLVHHHQQGSARIPGQRSHQHQRDRQRSCAQKIRDPRSQSIFVRADENVPFGAFATVMDSVKQAGFTNVSIVTQPLEQNGSKR